MTPSDSFIDVIIQSIVVYYANTYKFRCTNKNNFTSFVLWKHWIFNPHI